MISRDDIDAFDTQHPRFVECSNGIAVMDGLRVEAILHRDELPAIILAAANALKQRPQH